MIAPFLKRLPVIMTAICAVAGIPAQSQAQGMSEWGAWDGPRRMQLQQQQDVDQPDNDRDDQSDEHRDDDQRYGNGRDGEDRGGDDREYDNRRYNGRDNGRDDGRDDDNGDDDDRQNARRYDNRRDGDRGPQRQAQPRSQQPQPKAQPAPDSGSEPTKAVGVNGGPRPYIQASAPPSVAFGGPYATGSIVIDTRGRKLYFVTSPSTAFAYPIGVGREGFSWTGSEKVSRITDWPDWYPPAEMRQRKPELPERMLGGFNNPLGAKAIYLGNTLYRIHGTDSPKSIGRAESSGCFRMLNEHVLHLASLVQIGTQVTVVHSLSGSTVATNAAPRQRPATQPSPARAQPDDDERWRDREPRQRWNGGWNRPRWSERDYEIDQDDRR